MVVWPQCGGIFLDDALSWYDVLLFAESRGTAGFLIQIEHHSLLVVGVYLYLGGPAPLALHCLGLLGYFVGNGLLFDAVDAKLGRNDQRSADTSRCVA